MFFFGFQSCFPIDSPSTSPAAAAPWAEVFRFYASNAKQLVQLLVDFTTKRLDDAARARYTGVGGLWVEGRLGMARMDHPHAMARMDHQLC